MQINFTYRPSFEQHLSGPVVVDGEPELDDVEANVFVERIKNHFRIAGVEPSSVDEQKPWQKSVILKWLK